MNIKRLSTLHKVAILFLFAGLFMVAAHGAGLIKNKRGTQTSPILAKLPDVALEAIDGSTYSLSSLSQKRFILILGDDEETWEPQLNLFVNATTDLRQFPIVVVLPSVPEMDVLEQYGDTNVVFLLDGKNTVADSMKVTSFPRLVFIAEDLSVAGSRRPVFGDHLEGIRHLVREFSQGKHLSKTDLNLLSIGDTLPLFKHYSDREMVRKAMNDLPQKWLAIHFSAQCRYCVEELKSLKAMREARPYVLGITTSEQAEIEKLLAEIGIEIPVVYDPDQTIFNAHDVSSLPTVFLVDQKGKILEKLVGFSEEAFHRMTEEALTP